MQKEPRDACARGFFVPESQELNAKFDCYYVFILVVCDVYNNSMYKSTNLLGKLTNKMVNN